MKHPPNLRTSREQGSGRIRREILAGERDVDPVLRFELLGGSVRQLVDEVALVQPLPPGLRYLGTDGPRTAADLIRQGIRLLFGGRTSTAERSPAPGIGPWRRRRGLETEPRAATPTWLPPSR